MIEYICMAAVVFDNTIIFKHPFYPKCKATLQDISDRDYSSGSYQFDPRIECLDMDVYERVICQGDPDKTVDAVIGICTCGSDKRKSNPRLMLVELRMDYESVKNLSVTSLLGKVRHTKNLLGSGILIDNKSYFIFDKKIFNQARRWFSDKGNERGEMKNFVVYSVEDFNCNVLSYDDLPYIPINSPEQIKKDIHKHIKDKDIKALLKSLTYWLEVVKIYKYSNSFEFESLKDVFSNLLSEKNSLGLELNEDEEIDLEIVFSDFKDVFR